MDVVRRTRAYADLYALRSYIARDDPPAADRIARRLHDAAARLATFPHRGRPGRRRGTRELVISGTPYFVVYRVRGSSAVILRVLHGAQRWP